MAPSRVQQMDELVKELSLQDDPDRLVRVFDRQTDLLYPRDGLVTVSRRELDAPHYRVTRSWRQRQRINPWTDWHRLPVFDSGLLGSFLYAAKPQIVNRFAVPPNDPCQEHLEGMRALMCAPAYERGEVLSLVVVLRREPDSFTLDELETLLLNANLLGRAAGNLQLAQRLQEAYRNLDHEMQQVGQMQRHLLPTELPRIDGLELGASYVTCSRAGGDYYDVLPLPDNQWGLFLADVSGHGTPAAVVMAMLHTLLHAYPGPPLPPTRVLAHVNRHLLTVAPEGMFATAFYGVYDAPRRRLRYASAGHPPPRRRRRNNAVGDLGGLRGLPLGVLDEESWPEQEVQLVPGEALLLYTDGILEGTNATGEAFGCERLDDALRLSRLRAGPMVAHVERYYKDFCNGVPDQDDRTLLAAVAVP
jgi:sigma-B regulation protein RsbU (phosphoserine phosphatase)